MDARIKVSILPKLDFLFRPMRYKGARGGRGSAKSWSFARALLVQGATRELLILCTREVQHTIKESVHKLLADMIKRLGLQHFYEVLATEIRGANGTRFIFAGLSDLTVDNLKSIEGVDIVWIEEGQGVTKQSLDILIPTIRKDGSEIWVSYNPQLDTDPIHQLLVVNPPEDCICVLVNYNDNPWHNKVMEKERLRCKQQDPQNYPNIWEGECKPAVEGAIYYEQVAAAETNGQICNVPYDPMLKVHVVFDLGWNDAMSIALVQKVRSEIRIIEYIEDSHKTLDHYSATLKEKRLNWGKVWLPHDGFSRDMKTGKSSEEILKALGWDVVSRSGIIEMGLEEGIKATRQTFGQIYFDKHKCERLIQCAKRYRRAINRQTQEAQGPLHDEWSHGADCLRYVCINAEQMKNEDAQLKALPKPKLGCV